MDILSDSGAAVSSPRSAGLVTEDARRSGVFDFRPLDSAVTCSDVADAVDLGLEEAGSVSVAMGDEGEGDPVPSSPVPLRETGVTARSSLPWRGELALEGLCLSVDAAQLPVVRGQSGLAEAAIFGSTSSSPEGQCPLRTDLWSWRERKRNENRVSKHSRSHGTQKQPTLAPTYGRRGSCVGGCLGSGRGCEGRHGCRIGSRHNGGRVGLLVDHAAASERKGCGSGRGAGGIHQLPLLQLSGRCSGGGGCCCCRSYTGRAADTTKKTKHRTDKTMPPKNSALLRPAQS
uniref:Uncharacterized protein n=1 Tax=Anopheles farauti TaxID=69004 RepID=A0A182Q5B4_9DIPT